MNSNQYSRILMVLGVISLYLVFFAPLWQIFLDAAQFPGGLRLYIWVDKLSGDEGEGDIIANINILNHYIGMKKIDENSIPELKYFPKVIYAMMGLGLIAVFLNRSWSYGTWFGLILVLGILGIYDFYLWLYDYGHDLDPKAPIKVPGMSFMPPLFGEKNLLNFYVTSYPRLGAAFLGMSMLFSFLAFWLKFKRRG